MYTVKDNLIFGFHGCDETLCNQLVNGDIHLDYSDNVYDWLGKGSYLFRKMTGFYGNRKSSKAKSNL